jgi:hypothetical protein
MAEYTQPRRLNAVTMVLLLIAAATAYWFWRFFPAYFDGWSVDHILRESASATYRVMRLNEPARTKTLKAIVDKAREDIATKANVSDPDLVVDLNIDGNMATMTANYHVVITHPWINRTTTLHFTKSEKSDIKRVDWE